MHSVLIVDDDWFQRRLIIKLLKQFEWNCFEAFAEAEDGEAALEIMESFPAEVILTDIRMPRMNGIELLEAVKKSGKPIEVVLISTHSDFEYARQGIIHGAFDYLLKPIDKTNLSAIMTRLRNFLDERSQKKRQAGVEASLCSQLETFCSRSDVERLCTLWSTDPGAALADAETIAAKLFHFFDGDHLKVGLVLDLLLEKFVAAIIERHRWLDTFGFGLQSRASFQSLTGLDEIAALLRRVFLELTELHSRFHLDQPDAVIRQLCEYIAANSEDRITLETAARQFNFNADYLSKMFKSKTGMSFNDYVTKIKMERAKRLLRSGKYKNYEISELLGYRDRDYFCRLFKQYSGYTPSEYRRRPSGHSNDPSVP
ncbi:AraC family two component transcriptional regulator [Hydrogenispora ethanolica]|uniref:AraC family two component transcriptional regulator n=1 Tax=Hydrogenispora ethanolica TaxID=1082276 RepID=A0A4R1R912_HYDET|nr:response regulator [Hydrogenispora ethanolica]TCL61872.1 AraC family two component transcriptional regulator [Hydrogenispora ethanolica]